MNGDPSKNNCPNPEELLDFLESGREVLAEPYGTEGLDAHLGKCAACEEEIREMNKIRITEQEITAMLEEACSEGQFQQVQPPSRFRVFFCQPVRRFFPLQRPRWWPNFSYLSRILIYSGATAALILAVLLPQWLGPDEVQYRGGIENPVQVGLPQGFVDRLPDPVGWLPVDGAGLYRFQLLSDDGAVIWHTESEKPAVSIPQNIQQTIPHGSDLMIRVVAFSIPASGEPLKVDELLTSFSIRP